MADFKNTRDQSRLEKAAREDGSAWVHYEAEAEAVRKKNGSAESPSARQRGGGQKCRGRER